MASATRVSSVVIWESALSLRPVQPSRFDGDLRQPPLGLFRLARQRLRLRAHLGEVEALIFDLATDGAELDLDVVGRRQGGERALRFAAGGGGFVAARGQPRLRLGERRQPRGIASGLAFRRAVLVARAMGLALQFPPARARAGFGLGGGGDLGFGRFGGQTFGFDLAAHRLQLRFDIGEAVLAGEPARRAGRRVGGDRETVPAPEIAVARDQPLAGLEQFRQLRRVGAFDHADLGEPPRQFRRRRDVASERLGAVRQDRIGGIDVGAGPAHGRLRIDRGFEIVAEGCAERGLIAFLDGEIVEHRRPQVLGVDMQQPGERLRLGVEALRAALGLGERLPRDIERLAGGGMGGFGAQCGGFGFRDGGFGLCDDLGERGDIGAVLVGRFEFRKLRFDLDDLVRQPLQAIAVRAHGAFELIALGREVGERAGQRAEGFFRFGEHLVGVGHALVGGGSLLRIRQRAAAQRVLFLTQAGERRLGIRSQTPLALDIRRELREPQIELGHAVAGAGLFALERFARHDEALQGRRGARLGVAQGRKSGRRQRLPLGGFRLYSGAFGDQADRQILGVPGFPEFRIGGDPAQVEQGGFRLAHLRRDVAVADRLPRLLLERLHLAGELIDDVFQPQQVLLGRAQPQLRLVPPRMQPGNAGRLFQHAPALLGLGLDDLADAALVDQRRRARAGRGVGKQDMHVARAHLAAIDAIGRARIALDPARHIERFVLVELRRRLALGIVDVHRHFGIVARRAGVAAGEDHVVHVGGAHRLVGGFAHHPAQRLDQVRLAAAVRPDHAGEPRLDQEIGRLDEGLESEQA